MASYIEQHAGRGSLFKIFLVGIAGGDITSSGSGLNAVHREKARAMIAAALYLERFTGNEDDAAGIKCTTANATTSFALFISCGTPPPKKKKLKNTPKGVDTSIFTLRDKKGCLQAFNVSLR
jgi:hypothetical protein